MSYQTLTTSDGLIFALYGPVAGRRHDLTLLRNSGWNTKLENCLSTVEKQFYIFGDSAYEIRPWLQRPCRCVCTDVQKLFSTQMSSVRVSVEHNYKDLKQQWISQDFARNLMVRNRPSDYFTRPARCFGILVLACTKVVRLEKDTKLLLPTSRITLILYCNFLASR